MTAAPSAPAEHDNNLANISDHQVERAADLLAMQAGDSPQDAPANPDAPATPFPTSLMLTKDQEDRMIQFTLEYLERLINETGRIITHGSNVTVPSQETFFGKREIFTMRYYNHVQDRPWRTPHGIYNVSNITATVGQRIAMQMIARATNYYFGTDPWYSANMVGIDDRAKSQKVDRHSKWKFAQTGLKNVMREAVEFAFVRGESIVKTTYKTDDRLYRKKANALFDGATGQQVIDSKGNPVFDNANWVPETAPVLDPQTQQPAIDPATGQPAMQPTGRQVLRSDPQTVLPPVPIYKAGYWPMKRRVFEGPEAAIVFYKDMLIPLAAASLEEAEIVIHLYDMPVMSVVQNFQRADLAAQGAADSMESLRKAVAAIRNLATDSIEPSAAASQPRTDFKELTNSASPENPLCEVAEVYLRYDADGDGLPEEIMLVLDRKNRFPLFYDYLDNMTPDGERPFDVIRTKAVDGRWYGIGAMEYFQPEQEFIDLMVNRRNMRQSQAGRVTFWNPSATVEGQTNPNLRLKDGTTYRLREGYKAEDALSYVTLPDDGADLMELLNFFIQLMQLKSGIINAGDQKASGMDTGDTATGIRNVEESGQEMFAQFIATLEPGLSSLLKSQIKLLYEYISEPELFRFFDSKTGEDMHDVIMPDEVADMDFDVTILLTRVKAAQILQSSAESRALITEFYLQMPPQVQQIVAPFYQDSLRALGNTNADDLVAPQPVPPPGQAAPGQQAPAGPQKQAADGSAQIAASPQTMGIATPTPSSPAPVTPAPMI